MACANSDISGTTGANGANEGLSSPVCVGDAGQVVSVVVSLLLTAAALITFFMLIWGGIQYILSGGDPQKVSSAKGRLTFAIVGLTISFLSLIIFKILGNVLGFGFF